jgi:hypothetical protein
VTQQVDHPENQHSNLQDQLQNYQLYASQGITAEGGQDRLGAHLRHRRRVRRRAEQGLRDGYR